MKTILQLFAYLENRRLAMGLCAATLLVFVLPFAFRPHLALVDTPLPSWMLKTAEPEISDTTFPYRDIWGRQWFRLMQFKEEFQPANFKIDPQAFPAGCKILWFSTDDNTLEISVSDGFSDKGMVRRNLGTKTTLCIWETHISPTTLAKGVVLRPADLSRRSVFVRIVPGTVAHDHWSKDLPWSLGSRIWWCTSFLLSFLSLASLLAWYGATRSKRVGLTAICLAFLAGTLVFDAPFSGFSGIIDRGDDSYYLAYAQNLLHDGHIFREPTNIKFGSGQVMHNHGLPGTGIFLAPAAALQACLSGDPVRRDIGLGALRAMRLASAAYTLSAMAFLFLALRKLSPSPWNALFPIFLLWGTSLPKWTFQRCLFSHSVEMSLLCAILLIACYAKPLSRSPMRLGMAMAFILGLLCLVRGEYILIIPILPFLLGKNVIDKKQWIRYALGYASISAILFSLYTKAVSTLSSGYGNLTSSQTTQLPGSTPLAALAGVANHAAELFGSYLSNGGFLIIAFVVLSILIARRNRPADQHAPSAISLWGLAVLMLVFFMSNAFYHTPLGMEWQHRYSLKLYPLAFIVATVALHRIPARHRVIAQGSLGIFMAFCLVKNLMSYLDNGATADIAPWVWTDNQLVVQGLHSPYGLYVIMGVLCFAFMATSAFASSKYEWKRIVMGFAPCLLVAVLGVSSLPRDTRGGIDLRYFNDTELADASRTATTEDARISNGYGRPAIGVHRHSYSVRGEAKLFIPQTDTYSFFVEGKDGFRVFLDGECAVDNWKNTAWQGSGRHFSKTLEKGLHDLKFEHSKHSGDEALRMRWSGGPIPANALLGSPYLRRPSRTPARTGN